MTRHRLWIAAQLLFVVALVVFLGYALRDSWADAGPRLRDADPVDLAIAFVLLAIYYLLFVVGWQWILRALSVRVSYSVALQSEMASVLAKYVPGGICTPSARGRGGGAASDGGAGWDLDPPGARLLAQEGGDRRRAAGDRLVDPARGG